MAQSGSGAALGGLWVSRLFAPRIDRPTCLHLEPMRHGLHWPGLLGQRRWLDAGWYPVTKLSGVFPQTESLALHGHALDSDEQD